MVWLLFDILDDVTPAELSLKNCLPPRPRICLPVMFPMIKFDDIVENGGYEDEVGPQKTVPQCLPVMINIGEIVEEGCKGKTMER